MEYICTAGTSDMEGFTAWWESHLPAWMVAYCLRGEARLTLQFREHVFGAGMATIIAPDMFPAFAAASADFEVFYCLMSRDLVEKSFYDVPGSFFDSIYARPVLPVDGGEMKAWTDLLALVCGEGENAYRQEILAGVLRAFVLYYYNVWRQRYGDVPVRDDRSPAEAICMRFYNLVFDHFREHRAVAFYADRLCVTPNYLAMVTRKVCRESPKQAIDRQVTLEMKYALRHTGLTMEQLARLLHFPDTSYMCRYFRRQTGRSLSEYRSMGVEQQ